MRVNEDKQAKWRVDLGDGTVTHVDGWVFRYRLSDDAEEDFLDFECINWPQEKAQVPDSEFDRLLEEATSAYIYALKRRH